MSGLVPEGEERWLNREETERSFWRREQPGGASPGGERRMVCWGSEVAQGVRKVESAWGRGWR